MDGMELRLNSLDRGLFPRHVGLIMDGNGRWAEARGLSRIEGHKQGVRRVRELVEFSSQLGLKYLTLYVFSLENWQRPKAEVTALMLILDSYLRSEIETLVKLNIRFRVCGNLERLPANLRELLDEATRQTTRCTGMTLVAALSYGGRDEIVRAVKRLLERGASPGEITEDGFAALLDTAGIPDPDLVVRTSGEMRLSNFLIWQTAYSELYFTDVHWPDFDRSAFLDALENYTNRERRFGTVPAYKA